MKSPWNPDITTVHWEDGSWEGGFLVEWLSWNPIEFDDVSHLAHKEENGVSVTRAGFVLELCASTGMKMMQRFGVPELVLLPTQPLSNMSVVSSLSGGGRGLPAHLPINTATEQHERGWAHKRRRYLQVNIEF
ncbi:hypothetical protein GJ744_002582 [Endocarpon pusillum]|uniref:YTH domain-containing protein n=1 Tax=Endocarpon pusillum TaxID=364733 RepID=A0A8H7AA32_9EURO|nr:hypothetical protein GJ744_002582 [Endocarpon pusillum]